MIQFFGYCVVLILGYEVMIPKTETEILIV